MTTHEPQEMTVRTLCVNDDYELHSILRQALIEYRDNLNERRRQMSDALDYLEQNEDGHRDIPMLAERAEYFGNRYERIYDLLLAVDFGTVTIEYETLDDGL